MSSTNEVISKLPPIIENGYEEGDAEGEQILPAAGTETPNAETETETDAVKTDAEAGTDGESEDSEAETPSESSDELDEAGKWKALTEAYGRDPKAVLIQMASTLPKAEYDAVIAALNGQTHQVTPVRFEASDVTFREDDELTPEELFVKQHGGVIQAAAKFPEFQQATSAWVDQAAQLVNGHTTEIETLTTQNAILQAQVEALIEHSGLKLPKADAAKIKELVQKGKTHSEAVAKIYAPGAKAAVKKAQTEVPSTPIGAGQAAGGNVVQSGDPFVNMFNAVKSGR